MYPNTTERIFFSSMPNPELLLAKEKLDKDVSIKPSLQFQNHHFHESVFVPNCSQSTAVSDLVVLESSARLENNPISDLNQSWFTRTNSSQSHSTDQKGKTKKDGGGGYDAAGSLSLLLSKKENHCELKAEEQEGEHEEDGFRTPTSLDQRIPEIEQCPPAPRKPKPSLKRKAPQTHTCTPLYVSSKEVQLLFPVSDSHRIAQKVRRDDSK